MIDQLPEGRNIGWMQAPPEWVFTHTARFVGIVRILIQDGEGFILIRRGKPLVYYFSRGNRVLFGDEARNFFHSRSTIEFSLFKYTAEEFDQALRICNIDEDLVEPEPSREQVSLILEERTLATEPQSAAVPAQRMREQQEPEGELPQVPEPAPVLFTGPEPERVQEPVFEAPYYDLYEDVEPAKPQESDAIRSPSPDHVAPADQRMVTQEDPDLQIIGRIRMLSGIVAVTVFQGDQDILYTGEADFDQLLRAARSMLACAEKMTPHLDWGPFAHMTLQLPEGNIIIAPYRENTLCILTTRTINIGHIRRILRDLPLEK